MKLFEKSFYKQLEEDMISGAGGVFGDTDSMGHGGAVGNTDFYAKGDNRWPTGGEDEKKKKKPKGKRGKNVGVNLLMPVQRRPLSKSM